MSNKCKKGFTLLEVIISLGLMAIILIPTSNMVLGSVKSNKAGENKQQATVLLQETLECVKFSELPDEETIKEELDNGAQLEFISSEGEDKKYKISKEDNDYGISLNGELTVKDHYNPVYIPGEEINGNGADYRKKVDVGIKITSDAVIIEKYIDEKGNLLDAPKILHTFRREINESEQKIEIKEAGAGDSGQIFINGEKFNHHEKRGFLVIVEENRPVTISLDKIKEERKKPGEGDDKKKINFYVYKAYEKNGNKEELKVKFNVGNTNPVEIISSIDGSGNESEGETTEGTWISKSMGLLECKIKIQASKQGEVIDQLTTNFVKEK